MSPQVTYYHLILAVNSLQMILEFFCRKIELVREDIGQESVCELPTYDISCPSAKLERFSLVSDEEILSIIMAASSASCQLDPIPTWLGLLNSVLKNWLRFSQR